MKRNILVVAGFLLFLFGVISIVLNLVGMDLTFLKFLDKMGRLPAFIVKLFMIFGGVVLFYIARTDFFNQE